MTKKKEAPTICPICGGTKMIENGDIISCADCTFKASIKDYVND